MDYQVLKALHIIFVISWFAALFYIVRLFIYHVEAESREANAKAVLQDQFKIMQWRLWFIIGWPAMILTTLFGTWMLIENPGLMRAPFMHVKLGLVFGLILYHLSCHRILNQLKRNEIKWTSFRLRLWNELATIFMVAIVFVIVLKNELNWVWGVLGFFLFGMFLMLAVKAYKKLRKS